MSALKNALDAAVMEDGTVRLRPLSLDDFQDLRTLAYDEDIWRYSTGVLRNDEQLRTYLQQAEAERRAQTRFPFAIVDLCTGRSVGSMSYGSLSEKDSRIEIGWSWLGRSAQGTGINRRAKYLLLSFGLDELKLKRVEFKTDVLNAQARRALLKIGAVEEGVLRSHTLMHDGRRRDTIYYSVLQSEWDALKRGMFADLASGK